MKNISSTLSFIIFLSLLLIGYQRIQAQNENTLPYVVLISFDAFRWDFPARDLSPNLNELKTNGVSALSLQPCFPTKTFPNHLSIITGMYPENHGIVENTIYNRFLGIKYKNSDSLSARDSQWYLGEAFWETAERQGIKTASYYWPGSEIELDYRHPTYFEHYDHFKPYKERVNGVINWLSLPYEKKPHFISLYFEATDDAGHAFGPNSSECNDAISRLDSTLGFLKSELKRINMLDSVNIIVVSDHGMMDVSPNRRIDIESILKNNQINLEVKYQGAGTIMMLSVPDYILNKTYQTLKVAQNHFKVYQKREIPKNLHFSENIYMLPLLILPDPGWHVIAPSQMTGTNTIKGDHGWDNSVIEMHGIFFAEGPAFKRNYQTGTLRNIDIYPLLCKIFGIIPRSNIDGKLENIEFLLK